MPLVNSFNEYLPWADSTETISRLDRIAFVLVEIVHGNCSQRYNKMPNIQTMFVPFVYIAYQKQKLSFVVPLQINVHSYYIYYIC